MKQKSIFLKHLGDSLQLRVLEFLIDNHFFDCTKEQIIKSTGVKTFFLKKYLLMLEKNNLVIKTKKENLELYRLNQENPAVQQLIKLDWNLTSGAIQKEQEVLA